MPPLVSDCNLLHHEPRFVYSTVVAEEEQGEGMASEAAEQRQQSAQAPPNCTPVICPMELKGAPHLILC